jgi:eukaryotic-like serine/threonine-protein kinase
MATFYSDSPVRPDAPLLAGRFKLIRCIGGGSQGVAFVGRDLRDELDVVVKMLDPAERTVEECLAEARVLAALSSPHIVKVCGVGMDDGTPWMVFDRVDGPAVQMYRQAAPFGRLPTNEAVRITLGVLAGLDECHTKGFVHGSPHQNNVMLRRGFEPVLIDFGRVLPVGATDKATPTRDVAEAGQLLYTMLTGHTPSVVGQFEQLRSLEGCALDLMEALNIDSSVAAVTLRALDRDPTSRFQHAGEMRTALAALPHCASRHRAS